MQILPKRPDQASRAAQACLLVVCGWAAATLGCGPERHAAEEPLLVSAAVSLHGALRDAADGFQAGRGTRVQLNTGGSGLLLQQLLRGAPVDLYISASTEEIDRLEQSGRLRPGSRTTVASNRIAVVVPVDTVPPRSLHDLLDPRYRRIAIGNPRTSPAGRYARRLLEAHGLWQPLAPRLVTGESVRQALAYVARGEAEAGLVYRTDARLQPDRLVLALELAASADEPILYEGAILRDSARPQLAGELLRYLTSPEGRRRLAAYGFLPPP